MAAVLVRVHHDTDPFTGAVTCSAASPASSASRCPNWSSLSSEIWVGKRALALSADWACYYSKVTSVIKTSK